MKAVVYKIDNCNFCTQAEKMLEDSNIVVTVKNLKFSNNANDFKKDCPDKHTVPQIFIDGQYIGDYEKLRRLDLKQMYIKWCLNK